MPEIGQRYQFAIIPTQVEVAMAREKNQPAKFVNGSFSVDGNDPVAVNLSVYRDGIVADTRSSTADSDRFIEDLLTWLTTSFGLLPFEPIVKSKVYVSDVHVSTDRTLEVLNPKLADYSKLISDKSGHSLELSAIGFWPRQQELSSKPVPFRFERAEGVPFAQNRYYSIAPMQTEAHLEVLDKLEKLLA